MATPPRPPAAPVRAAGPRPAPLSSQVVGSLASTVSGPSHLPDEAGDLLATRDQRCLAAQKSGVQDLAAARSDNPLKPAELGMSAGLRPAMGEALESPYEMTTASTVQEDQDSNKVGDGVPLVGQNPTNGPLDRVRVDSSGRPITTNQGVKVADNQNSLKAGLRGPSLLEDFILREKITHFDHERIPERVVHARGSAAHGYFECYDSLQDLTRADPFATVGKLTPVFVRFSTVAGERGSADTVRDTRGFAVKFYTDEGNWDLVGNNIPVFFVQDAMKFPDVVHAVKPEPHHQMPQASSAHDTFWDFISLMPESIHHVMWVMSDRGIPRSYRTMQGFGVHTYRLVNADGVAVLVKFHWLPEAGTHSLVWDEAVKIAGADPDFHRRDLWEAIEAGHFPEYELALQVFTEAEAARFPFDVLDPTKLVPEELVPLRRVGRMVLNRNPDNFFAETEQVAFCPANVVPGIDFSSDPLLQGRLFSYLDTQLTRLGGPNFHEIAINAPLAQVHNHQRDGLHRQAIARGRVNYEPNSLGGGCPYQAGRLGFISAPEAVQHHKLRAKPESFADHYSQARLFWNSQTAVEKQHLIAAFRFELSRVTVPALRTRMLSLLVHVNAALADGVARGLGLEVPAPQVVALPTAEPPELGTSAALSLFARPGDGSAMGRRVALLVVDGVEGASLHEAHQALADAFVLPRYVGLRLGRVEPADGPAIEVEATLEALPSVLWDAVVLPAGKQALPALCAQGQVVEFVKEQYRHCKPMLVLDREALLLAAAGISLLLPDGRADPGLVVRGAEPQPALSLFLAALARHRAFERDTDPPRV
jgi:catalase